MQNTVTLTVIEGSLKDESFSYNQPTNCIIGRAEDCTIQFPDDEEHRNISGYHCELQIDPPNVKIRDLGSTNGTYVNDQKIGQRENNYSSGTQQQFPLYDLHDGDTIKLGETVFRVNITDQSRISPTISAISKTIQETEGTGINNTIQAINNSSQYSQKTNIFTRVERSFQKFIQSRRLGAIKDYKIAKDIKIGEGGTSEVYVATHIHSKEVVAFKIMLPEVATTKNGIERFSREVEYTRALNHPNIVRLLDYQYLVDEKIFFMTLEYCQGGNVYDLLINRGKPLSIDESLAIIFQVLDALDYAHQAEIPYVKLHNGKLAKGRGVVHRDIKPNNILITNTEAPWQVKISDFGLAKAFDLAGLSERSHTNYIQGTPEFMSYQQVDNYRYIDPCVDVWSTAATLYFMLTGQSPRKLENNHDHHNPFESVKMSEPRPILQLNDNIPQDLADVIDLALRDKPEIYFKSAQELKQALLQVI